MINRKTIHQEKQNSSQEIDKEERANRDGLWSRSLVATQDTSPYSRYVAKYLRSFVTRHFIVKNIGLIRVRDTRTTVKHLWAFLKAKQTQCFLDKYSKEYNYRVFFRTYPSVLHESILRNVDDFNRYETQDKVEIYEIEEVMGRTFPSQGGR